MRTVLAVIVVLAIVLVVVWFIRAQRSRSTPAPPPAPRDPFDPGETTYGDPRTLRAGDMIELHGERLFVRGSLRLRQGGYQWSEHFIDDVGGSRSWLSVEEDPDLQVVRWTRLRNTTLQPSSATLVHDGAEYRRDEQGSAQYTSEGTTGLNPAGRVEYVDFEGPGGKHLSFERFEGGEWEVAHGESVPPGTLTVYPGSDPATR